MTFRAADLLVGDQFQVPLEHDVAHRGRKGTVIEIGPSRMYEDHVRIVILGKRQVRAIIVLPSRQPINLLHRDKVVGKCRCKNHLGKQKIAYKSREDAASGILHNHIHHGEHRIYPCPTQEGRFHVTSKKARVHRPNG